MIKMRSAGLKMPFCCFDSHIIVFHVRKSTKNFVSSGKSRIFAPNQLAYRPIGKECRHPERILRKAAHVTAYDQPRRVFFVFQSPTLHVQPRYSTQEVGRQLVPGSRGRAPVLKRPRWNTILSFPQQHKKKEKSVSQSASRAR